MPRPRTGSVKFNDKRKAFVARLDWKDETGKDRCRKKQVSSKTEGKQVLDRWLRELEAGGSALMYSDRITFKNLADRYEKEILIEPVYRDGQKVAGLRDWKGARRRLRVLVSNFGTKPVKQITAGDLRRFRDGLLLTPTKLKKGERSVADVNRHLSLLRVVLGFAVEEGWIAENPFNRIRGLIQTALETERERVLTTEEQRRLLTACQNPARQHIFPLVLAALDSGCRRGELLKLRWREVDLDKGTITVIAQNAKTSKPRIIDLEPITIQELRQWKAEREKLNRAAPEDRVFGLKDNFHRAWHSALKESGIEEETRFHDLRATSITYWLVRGMKTEFAMLRSGHVVPKTFLRYVRASEEIRQNEHRQLLQWDLASDFNSLVKLSNTEIVQTAYVN